MQLKKRIVTKQNTIRVDVTRSYVARCVSKLTGLEGEEWQPKEDRRMEDAVEEP